MDRKSRKHRNKAWIEGDVGFIELRNKDNEPVGVAKVDREDLFRCLLARKWTQISYCEGITGATGGKRNGKPPVSLARFVLKIPSSRSLKRTVVPANGDPLDCRKENLYFQDYPYKTAHYCLNC